MVKTNPLGALTAAGGTLVAVGLLVLMLVVVEARPAEATFPGINGNIAYAGDQDGDLEIYKIPQKGGTPVPLTNNTKYDQEPSYSPDGTKIAYRSSDPDNEIFKISQRGGTPVKVTKNFTADRQPSWGSTPP